ncbi:MAG TPA: POTRA domain-containing protein [Terriglobales bacterium]|nr:POTRA domain-containing protein [Terriglobales bacterium]
MSRVTRFALFLCLLVSAAAAQKSSTSKASSVSAYKLIALKATGTARYTDKEILAASGLQLGQNAADGDFKEAVQRLGESGLFSNVVYSYSSSSAGTKLELQLADADQSKLVPARFENFVWFTDAELQIALQSRVPLFKQLLPLSGNLPDHVSEALQSILTEKHFPGRVDYLRAGDASGGALNGIDYRVDEVSIRIRDVEFPGASPEQTALLTTAAHRLAGAEYGRSTLSAAAKFDLLPVYLQRGYLKAAFGLSDARVVPQSSVAADPQGLADVLVDAIVPVTPGKVYSTSGVEWKGNSALTAGELAPLLHLPTGQPADAVRLLRDLENVTKLYRSRGYMMVQIKPDAQFDDEKSTVHYGLNVVEGDLYKMGDLEITGLDTQATARMRAAWTLHEGQAYNADYLKKFLVDTEPLLPHGVHWAVSIHETPDAKDKTVDVEIRFKQQ